MQSAERRKVNVLEMKCCRRLVAVSRKDSVRNVEVCLVMQKKLFFFAPFFYYLFSDLL